MAYSVQYFLTILGSFFFHLVVFKWFAAPVLRRLWPIFAAIPNDKQVFSQTWYDCPITRYAGSIIMGYTAADLLLIYPAVRSRDMLVHHVCTLWMGYFASMNPVVPYYASLSMMTEMSTPFLNVRHILLHMGEKSSVLYKVNGVVLLVTFFTCRILTIPLWLSFKEHFGTEKMYEVGFGVLLSILVLIPFVHLLNIFWFTRFPPGSVNVNHPAVTPAGVSVVQIRASSRPSLGECRISSDSIRKDSYI
uniref:TLC domain-containing protein n=1 Tax=Branchiostoma floridae TaxID=7739 RepID=C3YTN2_BRAFL|eukprot:XP_002600147.1 hypothetical protein BRAFLDRAFT_118247 [Branchiostoma floridae]